MDVGGRLLVRIGPSGAFGHIPGGAWTRSGLPKCGSFLLKRPIRVDSSSRSQPRRRLAIPALVPDPASLTAPRGPDQHLAPGRTRNDATMSGLASKQQSLKIFEKLKTKQANKVSTRNPARSRSRARFWVSSLWTPPLTALACPRSASTAAKRTRPGHQSRLASTCASTAPPTTATSACTSRLSAPRTSTVRPRPPSFAPPFPPPFARPPTNPRQNGNGTSCVS